MRLHASGARSKNLVGIMSRSALFSGSVLVSSSISGRYYSLPAFIRASGLAVRTIVYCDLFRDVVHFASGPSSLGLARGCGRGCRPCWISDLWERALVLRTCCKLVYAVLADWEWVSRRYALESVFNVFF